MTGQHRRPSPWRAGIVGGAFGALLVVAVLALALATSGADLVRALVGPVEPVAAMTVWDDDDRRGALRCEQWSAAYGRGASTCQVRPIDQAPDRDQAEAGRDAWTARYGPVLG